MAKCTKPCMDQFCYKQCTIMPAYCDCLNIFVCLCVCAVYVEGTSQGLETSTNTSVYKNDRNQWRTSKVLYNGFEVPVVLLFISTPIIPSWVEALLIPSVWGTCDPGVGSIETRQDKCVCVCVCVYVCVLYTVLHVSICVVDRCVHEY